MRQKGFSSVDHTPEVDVDDALDVFELRLLHVAVVGNAGVVVDPVDGVEMCDGGVSAGQYGFPFSDVESIGTDVCAQCLG